jgi:hypothetical protein
VQHAYAAGERGGPAKSLLSIYSPSWEGVRGWWTLIAGLTNCLKLSLLSMGQYDHTAPCSRASVIYCLANCHCWLVAPLYVDCTILAASAVDAPLTASAFPL